MFVSHNEEWNDVFAVFEVPAGAAYMVLGAKCNVANVQFVDWCLQKSVIKHN